MPDYRIVNLARTLVDYSTRIKTGDQVFIMASPAAAPLVQELYKQIIQRGAHPLVLADLPGLNAIFFEHANEEQLRYVSPVLKPSTCGFRSVPTPTRVSCPGSTRRGRPLALRRCDR
jgi:aminopeptidase